MQGSKKQIQQFNEIMQMHESQTKAIENMNTRFEEFELKFKAKFIMTSNYEPIYIEPSTDDHLNEDGKCMYCGWMSEFMESHIEHAVWEGGCKYIQSKYDMWRDEDGELQWKKKE